MNNLTADKSRPGRSSLQKLLLPVALLVASLIFAIDTQIKLGVAVGALHVIPVLIIAPLESRRLSLVIAFICTALIGIKLVFWPIGEAIPWMVFANRGISIFVVWVTVILGLYLVRTKRQLREIESLLTVCAWTKQVKVGDQWIPFDQYLTKYLGFKITHGITEEEANRLIQEVEGRKSKEFLQANEGGRAKSVFGNLPGEDTGPTG